MNPCGGQSHPFACFKVKWLVNDKNSIFWQAEDERPNNAGNLGDTSSIHETLPGQQELPPAEDLSQGAGRHPVSINVQPAPLAAMAAGMRTHMGPPPVGPHGPALLLWRKDRVLGWWLCTLLPMQRPFGLHSLTAFWSLISPIPTGPQELRSRLARSGHAAVPMGNFVAIIGGILRDNCLQLDMLVVRMDTLTINRSVTGWVAAVV